MSTYLVLKRFKHHGVDNMPGTKLTDAENATILMERGFITPVPDNFTSPPATTRARAPESAGSGARRPSKAEAEAKAKAKDEAEAKKAKAEAEAEAEAALIAEAVAARPDILDLSKATEESVETLMKESDENYQELVRTFLTEPNAGTVGAAEDTGASPAPLPKPKNEPKTPAKPRATKAK